MGVIFSNDVDELLGPDSNQVIDRLTERETAYLNEGSPDDHGTFAELLDVPLNVEEPGGPVSILPEYLIPGPLMPDFLKTQIDWDYLAIYVSARDTPSTVFTQWVPTLPFSIPKPPGASPFNHVGGGSGTLNRLVRFNVFAGGQESGIYNESVIAVYHRHYLVTGANPPPTYSVTIGSSARKVSVDATVATQIPFSGELSATLTGRVDINSITSGLKDPDLTVKNSQGQVIANVKPNQFFDDWTLSFKAPNKKGKYTLNRSLQVSGNSYSFQPAANSRYAVHNFLEMRVKSKGDWNGIWLKYEDDPKLMI